MARNKSANTSGKVKKSSAIAVALLTFALGLYGGHLISSLKADQAESGGDRVSIRAGSPTGSEPGSSSVGTGGPAVDFSGGGAELAALRKAVADAPEDINAWNRLGHWYFDHQQPAEAIRAYETSLRLKPDDPDIITDLGVMYRSLHEHEKALELFRRANRLAPWHEPSLFNTGVALLDVDKKTEAIEAWKKLQQKTPASEPPEG